MIPDEGLMQTLLMKLVERQAALQEGDNVLIQPPIEGIHVEYPLDVPGYKHDQIDFHLRLLSQRRLIETDIKDWPAIGILFRRVTPAGQAWLRMSG